MQSFKTHSMKSAFASSPATAPSPNHNGYVMNEKNQNLASVASSTATRDYFADLFGGNRDCGAEYAKRRLGMLVITADLSKIKKAQFELLCHIFNGIETTQLFDAQDALLSGIHGAVMEQDEYREDIEGPLFAYERARTRSKVLWGLGAEKHHLLEMATLIEALGAAACLALLIRIEEVFASRSDDLTERCAAIYEKMKSRRQL
jgi:hypothetical protein